MKNAYQYLIGFILIGLQILAVIGVYYLMFYVWLNGHQLGLRPAVWYTLGLFAFFSPLYIIKIYIFIKTGEYGEEDSSYLPPLKTDILFWGSLYLFFEIINFITGPFSY